MVRFIIFCFAIIAFAFIAMPIFSGISGEKEAIENRSYTLVENQTEDALTFEEIYEIAAQGQTTPENLNAIAPAAGDSTEEDFSGALKESQHPAL